MTAPQPAPPHPAPPFFARALDALLALEPGLEGASATVSAQGADPIWPSRFPMGEAAAAALAAIGVALGALRPGPAPRVDVDVAEAAATLRAMEFTTLAGPDGAFRKPDASEIAAIRACIRPFPTADGGHFLPHLNLPHLRDRVLSVLGCPAEPAPMAAAIARWDAPVLEEAIAEARACGAMVRTAAQWRAHPQGIALSGQPVVRLTRLGDAPPEPLPHGPRPLSGLRVLDLTRILAGPVAARTLAEHGADVLMIAAERLPQVEEHVRETSHGKRSAFLDLDRAEDAAQLRALIRGADVVSQGYRPGRLAARGLGAEALAALRPGIVAVSVSCYGSGGPLDDRAGWEQVAQAATGMAVAQGETMGGPPALAPAAVCDFLTGYLAAYGALLALGRRAREGGSWAVEVSLCRSAMFLLDLGLTPEGGAGRGVGPEDVAAAMVETDGPRGRMRHLGPVLRMGGARAPTPAQSPRLGTSAPAWAAG